MKIKADYAEFTNSKLVTVYNSVNPIDSYKDFYLKIAEKLSAKKIIDLGCGSGLLTCELVSKGFDLIGVEPSQDMLDLARKSSCGDAVDWVLGDALILDEYNADLTIMTGHVAQFYLQDEYWNRALSSIHRALNAGGYLVFESRNPLVKPWFKSWPSSEREANIYTSSELGEVKWWYEPVEVNKNHMLYKNKYRLNDNHYLESVNELIFRSKNELEDSLKANGFLIENIYGDWNWSSFTEKSPELIFVAKKI